MFIDGTWLYATAPRLSDYAQRAEYHLDFGKLPGVLCDELAQRVAVDRIDLVRTHLFGSYASNYDHRDEEVVQRRLDFFAMLREEHHYEVEMFPINFRGRRIRKIDRDPRDTFEPRENIVDIAMVTSMLTTTQAAGSFDVAIAVLGDIDFKPALQQLRRLGKRVMIATIRGSCAPELGDPADPDRLKDFDIVWLDEMLNRLELKFEPHWLECEAEACIGERRVWTTFHPRKGQKFYCDACRAEFAKKKAQQRASLGYDENMLHDMSGSAETATPGEPLPVMTGEVKKKVADRGFGFIQASDGFDYFFHLSDLESGLDFLAIQEGMQVTFEVKRAPSAFKAGAAVRVRKSDGNSMVSAVTHLGHEDDDM